MKTSPRFNQISKPFLRRSMAKKSGLILLLLAIAAALAGCAALVSETPGLVPTATATQPALTESPTLLPPAGTPATPSPAATGESSSTGTPPGSQTLLIWLPPQFDPSGGTPAGNVLRARLDAFQAANPGYKVMVRIKAASGQGGLLDALSITAAAAPGAVPALVALPRADMEAAALKGLVYPLDGLTHLVDDPDWYAYARQLALIQGSVYGLPFAGDVMLLLYRPQHIPNPPADWPAILNAGLPLSFPAADPQANLTLLLYLSAGGQVKDSQGRPTLQADVLAKVLTLYAEGVKKAALPAWLAPYQTDLQAWQAFRDQRAQWLVTWSSRLLVESPAETAVVGLPSPGAAGSPPLTLATGWMWALSTPETALRPAAVKLAEDLSSSEFMSQWTAAAGYLPTRPTALAAWSNQALKAALSSIVLAAQARPSSDLMASLGPVLLDATQQVIKEGADPTRTAQAAADRLAAPPSH
jgi:multiple sugar transport system substrate-binding protein